MNVTRPLVLALALLAASLGACSDGKAGAAPAGSAAPAAKGPTTKVHVELGDVKKDLEIGTVLHSKGGSYQKVTLYAGCPEVACKGSGAPTLADLKGKCPDVAIVELLFNWKSGQSVDPLPAGKYTDAIDPASGGFVTIAYRTAASQTTMSGPTTVEVTADGGTIDMRQGKDAVKGDYKAGTVCK